MGCYVETGAKPRPSGRGYAPYAPLFIRTIQHGLTLRVRRTVLPCGLKNPPSLTPVAYGEEGRFDTALRAGKYALGHNWASTFDGPRESVFESRGNAQPHIPFGESSPFMAGRMSDVPRGCTTEELADELGISDQAVTERLRRAINAFVRETLPTPARGLSRSAVSIIYHRTDPGSWRFAM
jgi:hypothetical protein